MSCPAILTWVSSYSILLVGAAVSGLAMCSGIGPTMTRDRYLQHNASNSTVIRIYSAKPVAEPRRIPTALYQ